MRSFMDYHVYAVENSDDTNVRKLFFGCVSVVWWRTTLCLGGHQPSSLFLDFSFSTIQVCYGMSP